MGIYSNVTEQDLIILRKMAEQQKNQRAEKIKKRILKQTHDVKLAESISPVSKKLDGINESTKQLGELVKKPNAEDGNTQTPPIENTTSTRSLCDTLSFMKQSNNFFHLEETNDGKVYWNDVRIKPVRESKFNINGKDYNVTPSILHYFTKTKSTTKSLNNNDEETVFDIIKDVGFSNKRHTKGLKSTRHKDAMYDLPKGVDMIRNPPLPAIENVEDSSDLQEEGVKIIIPSNLTDIYTRLEVLIGVKLSGHTDALSEASNLFKELYKRGEIQNKQQYRNAPNKFSSI